MKSLIISLIILPFAMMTKQSDYLLIEHVGISDKPIPSIIISKKTIENPNDTRHYLVSKKDYDTVKDIILKFNKVEHECEKNEFGSFNLVVNERASIKHNYLLGRKDAILLFIQITEALKKETKNEKLVSELEMLQKRIKL